MSEEIYNRVLSEYIKRIEDNVLLAQNVEKQARETANIDENGNWSFTIKSGNYIVSETITIGISNENIGYIAPEAMVENKSLEMAITAILDNDNDYKNSGKTHLSYLHSLSKDGREDCNKKARDYLNENKAQITHEATKELLISNAVMPRIVNRGLQQSAYTAEGVRMMENGSDILAEKDNGYCTKSLFMPLYEMKYKYGGFGWLPDNAETASHPQSFKEKIHTDKKHCINDEPVNLNAAIKEYQAGALVLVDQGNGHMHAMMYNGLNNVGEPQYIGFNSNDFNRQLSDNREGFIINLPQLIKEDIESGTIQLSENIAEKASSENFGITASLYKDNSHEELKEKTDPLSRGETAQLSSIEINRQTNESAQMANKIMALRGFSNPRNQQAAEQIGEKKLEKTRQTMTEADIKQMKINTIGGKGS